VIVATLETRHWSFCALGKDEAQAREALRRGWEVHREQTSGSPWEYFSDGVVCVELEPGQCTRDGDILREIKTCPDCHATGDPETENCDCQ
jgi:hypothetical protein